MINNQKIKTFNLPFQEHIQVLNNWKNSPEEKVKASLNYFLTSHNFKSLAQYNDFSKFLTQFHKQISKSQDNQQTICQQFFELTRSLKKKLKQLENQGNVKIQKLIKSKVIKVDQSFKNLVDGNIQYPNDLLVRKNVFQAKMTTALYRSFVTFYPQAHSKVNLNIKTVKFICSLFEELQRKYYSYPNKNYFIKQVDKICVKFQKAMYLQNKKRMLSGQIKVEDIIQNRKNAFENIGAKQTEEINLINIFKDSQILLQKKESRDEDSANSKIEQKQNYDQNGKMKQVQDQTQFRFSSDKAANNEKN